MHVLDHLSHDLVHGIFSSADLSCVVGTVKRTFTAEPTLLQMIGAFFFAFSTVGAFVLVKHHLRLSRLAFGIVAPSATQITSLEKDRCTDTRTVHK